MTELKETHLDDRAIDEILAGRTGVVESKTLRGSDRGTARRGAAGVRRCPLLRAGLLDELQIHVVPVLLGAGTRLFDGLDGIELEPERVIASADVTHVRFRVVR